MAVLDEALTFFAELGAEFLTVKREGDSLAAIAREVGACSRCPLGATRTHAVPGEGAETPPILFIGEGPGETEDRFGRPFIGPAGELLTRIIEKMGFPRSEVFITNVVKCRPPGNRVPTPVEAAACRPFLDRQIRLLKPRVIVCLGKPATNFLLGAEYSITKIRGTWLQHDEVPVMPTFHPSYILHQKERKAASEAKWQVWSDMERVQELLRTSP